MILIHIPKIPSTQSLAIALLTNEEGDLKKQAVEAGMLHKLRALLKLEYFGIYTLRQTAGYGQYQRNWICPTGNIALTICMRIHPRSISTGYTSLIIDDANEFLQGSQFTLAAIITSFIQEIIQHTDETCIHKPINDVLIGDKKIAGILTQIVKQPIHAFHDLRNGNLTSSLVLKKNPISSNIWLIGGIGINVLCTPKVDATTDYTGATSIYEIFNKHSNKVNIRERLKINLNLKKSFQKNIFLHKINDFFQRDSQSINFPSQSAAQATKQDHSLSWLSDDFSHAMVYDLSQTIFSSLQEYFSCK